jgi:hypothetical protein
VKPVFQIKIIENGLAKLKKLINYWDNILISHKIIFSHLGIKLIVSKLDAPVLNI